MKQILLIIGLLLGFIHGALADQDYYLQRLHEGNAAYESENYEDAISAYREVLDAELENQALYYNLGNAHYKLGRYPEAILYYERAKKLDPTDPDVAFNLQIANEHILDKIEPLPVLFYESWGLTLLNLLTSRGWAYVALISIAFGAVLFYVYLVTRNVPLKKITFFLALFAWSVTALTSFLSYQQYKALTEANAAIVFDPTVTVKSEPDEKSTQLFVVHEGSKVELLEEANGWYKISLADGNIGWLPVSTVVVI
ncbi:MAG: tetratricopeptide repeat protein [Leptolyngbya sp. SIO3F4]|nr:tetratricopeptide repeat protein [Leptolyngbya sp. SIO3F4]